MHMRNCGTGSLMWLGTSFPPHWPHSMMPFFNRALQFSKTKDMLIPMKAVSKAP